MLNDLRVRAVLWQILVIGAVLLAAWYLVDNTLANLRARNIATGAAFLGREAGFDISEHLPAYSPTDTYARALMVGLVNTLQVSVIAIVLATILGTVVGIARLSGNWLVARLATVYVEGVRNVPLLLQLFVWYAVITQTLPRPPEALNPLPGVFLSNRGLRLPTPVWETGHSLALLGLAAAVVTAWLWARHARRRHEATGSRPPVLWPSVLLIAGLPVVGWLLGGAPTAMDVPSLRGFNFVGGTSISPEFAALLAGLTVYTASFIAEIVRGGILAVPHGQTEAAQALGLSRGQILRLIVLPQALRVIVPPLTSQYLNLTKNSSLAIAIGYPDLVSVANTTINQTGQAVEGVAIIMAAYLAVSLGISLFMNWYNERIALKGGGR